MDHKIRRRSNCNNNNDNNYYRVVAFTLALCLLVCMPIDTHSLTTRGECYLPPDEGFGNRLILRVKYYFDPNSDDCFEFIYLGRGGNKNRFDTYDECENICLFNYGV